MQLRPDDSGDRLQENLDDIREMITGDGRPEQHARDHAQLEGETLEWSPRGHPARDVELVEELVEQQFLDVEDTFDDINREIDSIQREVQQVQNYIYDLQKKKRKADKELMAKAEDIELYLEHLQARIADMEELMADSLPVLVRNMRDLAEVMEGIERESLPEEDRPGVDVVETED